MTEETARHDMPLEGEAAFDDMLPPLEDRRADAGRRSGNNESLEAMGAVYDIPVRVQAVLGRAFTDIGKLMQLRPGDVLDLDRRVGEPVDIFVNNRMIARGEGVLIDGVLGVTLTEIVKDAR